MAFDEPTTRPPWRPTKYDPSLCDRVVELGAEGKSRTEIAVELGVSRQTLHNWSDEYPDFLDAMTRAKEAEQCWWERAGRININAQYFQSSMWSRSMAARFPEEWRESTKNEIVGKDNSTLVPVINVTVGRDQS